MLINFIGLVTLYSITLDAQHDVLVRQIMFSVISFAVMLVVSKIDYTYLQSTMTTTILAIINLVLLVLVLFIGPEINNVHRWFKIGNFLFQPSELAKFIIILTVSYIITSINKPNIWIRYIISIGFTLINSIIIFKEPDAGMALICSIIGISTATLAFPNFKEIILLWILVTGTAIITISTIFLAKIWLVVGIIITIAVIFIIIKFIKPKNVLKFVYIIGFIGTISASAFGIYAWNHNILIKEYQKERIYTLLNPQADPQGTGFQIAQSIVAIGSGRIFGKGFGQGTQSKLRFLPEHTTDFIFAAFAEEFGLIGSIVLLILYFSLFAQLIWTTQSISDPFGAAIYTGVAIKTLIEVIVNIGMNLGATPATGVPLPFFSYGGSNLLINYTIIGILISITAVNSSYIFTTDNI